MPSGGINVSEYNLGAHEGKATWFFPTIENRLYRNNKSVYEVKVNEEQVFFNKDGTVKTAMDKNWNKNLGEYDPETDPLLVVAVVPKS